MGKDPEGGRRRGKIGGGIHRGEQGNSGDDLISGLSSLFGLGEHLPPEVNVMEHKGAGRGEGLREYPLPLGEGEKIIGVLSPGELHHPHVEADLLKDVHPLYRRFLPREVRVVADIAPVGKPADEQRLLFRQGCAEGGARLGEPAEMKPQGVHIPLHENDPVQGPDRLLCPVKEVEIPPFAVEGPFGAVDVFRPFAVEETSAEGEKLACDIPDGEDDPAPETVVKSVLPLEDESRLKGLGGGDPLPGKGFPEGIPGGGSPAELKGGPGFRREIPPFQVAPRRRPFGSFQKRAVEGKGLFEDVIEIPVSPRKPGVGSQGDPRSFSEDLKGLPEGEAFLFHHEGEDIPAPAAAEAVPCLPGGGDAEGGGFFIMKGAES